MKHIQLEADLFRLFPVSSRLKWKFDHKFNNILIILGQQITYNLRGSL